MNELDSLKKEVAQIGPPMYPYLPPLEEQLPTELPVIVVRGKDESYVEMVRKQHPHQRVLWADKQLIYPPLQPELPPKKPSPVTYIPYTSPEEKIPKEKKRSLWWLWLLLLGGGIGVITALAKGKK